MRKLHYMKVNLHSTLVYPARLRTVDQRLLGLIATCRHGPCLLVDMPGHKQFLDPPLPAHKLRPDPPGVPLRRKHLLRCLPFPASDHARRQRLQVEYPKDSTIGTRYLATTYTALHQTLEDDLTCLCKGASNLHLERHQCFHPDR